MATIAFTCGAEHTSEFTTSHWFSNTPNSGAVTVDTTHVDSSPHAIKVTADASLRKIANTGRYFAARMRIWLPSGAATGTRVIELDDGGSGRLLQYNTVAGKMQWYDGTDSTLAFPLDQWVTVDIEIDASANPHTTNWKINGVAQTSTSAALAANNVVQYYLGGYAGSSDRWVDNLAVSLTPGDYPIPAGKSLWNGSAEVYVPDITSTATFVAPTSTWAATATNTDPVSGGGPSVGGLAYIGRLSPKQRRQEPVTDVVALPEPEPEPEPIPEPVLIAASAAFSQRPVTWASAMTYNDDELVLEMLATTGAL